MLSLCCVTDDKPGHKSQVEGLLKALQQRQEVRVQWLNIHEPSTVEPPLDLILCAGRLTHIPALKTRWKLGGKVVCLSKSWIPTWLFDLNVLPRHDGVPEKGNVWVTSGSMNAIRASSTQDNTQGLILIGGPSANHGWNQRQIMEQLRTLIANAPDVQWTLTTSRRTPAEFTASLAQQSQTGFSYVPMEETSREWLLQQYQCCGNIWVTEDSVSMVCESLSSGAIVGVFRVPRLKQGRVSGNLDNLVADRHVLTLEEISAQGLPREPFHPPLQEADRIAKRLLSWLQDQERS